MLLYKSYLIIIALMVLYGCAPSFKLQSYRALALASFDYDQAAIDFGNKFLQREVSFEETRDFYYLGLEFWELYSQVLIGLESDKIDELMLKKQIYQLLILEKGLEVYSK